MTRRRTTRWPRESWLNFTEAFDERSFARVCRKRFFGGALRYLVNVWLPARAVGFPFATLLVNVVASLAIGVLLAYLQKQMLSPQQYLLLAVGFCGGLSTFSAFAVENQQMILVQQFGLLGLYVSASVTACIGTATLGKMIVG